MATVQEIAERIAREEAGVRIANHALGSEASTRLTSLSDGPAIGSEPWPTRVERESNSKESMKRPVRKVSYSAVAGIVTAAVLWVLTQYNIVLDPEVSGAIVLAIMTLIGYVVPLSDRDLANLKIKN